MPISYVVDRIVHPRPDVSRCPPGSDYPLCPARQVHVFQFVSAGYLALMLMQLVAQHSLLSDAGRKLHGRLAASRNLHVNYVGTPLNLTVPWTSWLAYSTFWLATGSLKIMFGYYALAKPLVIPLSALWNLEFDGQGGERESFNLFQSFVRLMVISLRMATPTCVFFFDTNIFYTIMSSVCSTLVLAQFRRIGRITTWGGLLTRFAETTELHGQRLLCKEKAPSPPRVTHAEQLNDWCIEARSHQWQLMSRSWNEIIRTLRACDLLTDSERDEMLFSSLTGPQASAFSRPRSALASVALPPPSRRPPTDLPPPSHRPSTALPPPSHYPRCPHISRAHSADRRLLRRARVRHLPDNDLVARLRHEGVGQPPRWPLPSRRVVFAPDVRSALRPASPPPHSTAPRPHTPR